MNLEIEKQNNLEIINNYFNNNIFKCCICKNINNLTFSYSSTGRKRFLCKCGAKERQRSLI